MLTMKRIFKKIKDIVQILINSVKFLITTVLNIIDTLMLLFTYLSIVGITVISVALYLEGFTFNALIGSIIVLILVHVNKSIRGDR